MNWKYSMCTFTLAFKSKTKYTAVLVFLCGGRWGKGGLVVEGVWRGGRTEVGGAKRKGLTLVANLIIIMLLSSLYLSDTHFVVLLSRLYRKQTTSQRGYSQRENKKFSIEGTPWKLHFTRLWKVLGETQSPYGKNWF